ncbi:spike base protein, RCAP_Rcc01079 family [Devosia elaeis]|uniref:Uncharacterized protein n=1 Tax=Devosia elaeis TaxID=1770058 RepID=A0A178I102_9HYPH|nr:hypothetical protein [Devosia elaeis]OAM78577.1 hypothetical protein A3840_05635 [Devosia elaeis]
MADRYSNREPSMEGPAVHAFSIVPHDTNALPETTRAIYVGGFGALRLVLASGTEITFANLPAGTALPVRATHVRATGTSATDIVGLV